MLHLVFQSNIDTSLIDRIGSRDDVVFLENAIFRLIKNSVLSDELQKVQKRSTNLYVLACDIETRGVLKSELSLGIKTIEYPELVKLAENNKVIRTWS